DSSERAPASPLGACQSAGRERAVSGEQSVHADGAHAARARSPGVVQRSAVGWRARWIIASGRGSPVVGIGAGLHWRASRAGAQLLGPEAVDLLQCLRSPHQQNVLVSRAGTERTRVLVELAGMAAAAPVLQSDVAVSTNRGY